LAGVIILGAGLALSGCQDAETPSAHAESLEAPTEILKDFVMNDVRNGVKNMTLKSVEGRIYETRHVADVDKPFLTFYKEGKESSRLVAPMGRLETQTHEVECWGGVTVISADSSTLTTERLRYDPKIRKIFSDDSVHLDKPDSITDGIGLETDPELKSVKIGKQKVTMKSRHH
jgi:LPS export ABC transporter protein LptC